MSFYDKIIKLLDKYIQDNKKETFKRTASHLKIKKDDYINIILNKTSKYCSLIATDGGLVNWYIVYHYEKFYFMFVNSKTITFQETKFPYYTIEELDNMSNNNLIDITKDIYF